MIFPCCHSFLHSSIILKLIEEVSREFFDRSSMALLSTTVWARHEQLSDRLRANKTRPIFIFGLTIGWILGSAIFAFGISIHANHGYI